MYNRYVPNGTSYTRIRQEDGPTYQPVIPPAPTPPPPPEGQAPPPTPPPPLKGFPKPTWLNDLLSSFQLDSLDAGDILLLLILLFIFIDGDDLELVITLGLLLFFGLGDKEKADGFI